MIMTLFAWSLVSICSSMLMIQFQMVWFIILWFFSPGIYGSKLLCLIAHFIHSQVLFVAIINSAYAFGTVFIVCEICQQLSNESDEIYDVVEQFGWYRFPNTTKKMMPMIIQFVQQPVAIECFGSYKCHRETFRKVSPIKTFCILE